MSGYKEDTSVKLELEFECALDSNLLSEMEWFTLSGGTPRKERNNRRNVKAKSWKIVDLCTWIGKKVS